MNETTTKGLYCRICFKEIKSFFDLPRRPIVNRLYEDIGDSSKFWEIKIYLCEACDFLQLKSQIPPEEFYSAYATPSKWKIEPHLETVVEKIDKRAKGARESSMIEIGCNDGKLLDKVRKMGFVKVLGVEPSWKALEKILDSVQVYPEYFTESLATKIANEFGKFDVIVSRHVLEHIDNLHNFVRGLRIISKKDATLYIEVPDVVTFARKKDFAYWEEHLNYFSEENLIQLFAGHGFRFVKKDSFLFSGIAQLLEFSYSEQSANRINKIDGDKKTTLDHFKSQIVMAESDFRKLVDSIHSKDGRIFLWGIGSRSLGTLFSLRAINLVDFFIDENDNKIGKVVPGTGKFVAYPEFFKSEVRGNDLILLGVNYENERRVLDKLSLLGNTIHSLLSPSPIMWNHTQPACQEVG